MDIGFIWDEDKYQDIQKRYDIQFYEVVSAFDAGRRLRDEYYRRRNGI